MRNTSLYSNVHFVYIFAELTIINRKCQFNGNIRKMNDRMQRSVDLVSNKKTGVGKIFEVLMLLHRKEKVLRLESQ